MNERMVVYRELADKYEESMIDSDTFMEMIINQSSMAEKYAEYAYRSGLYLHKD